MQIAVGEYNNNKDDDYVDPCNLSFSIKVTREAVDDPIRIMRAASVWDALRTFCPFTE